MSKSLELINDYSIPEWMEEAHGEICLSYFLTEESNSSIVAGKNDDDEEDEDIDLDDYDFDDDDDDDDDYDDDYDDDDEDGEDDENGK
jgi:hypothetical protein